MSIRCLIGNSGDCREMRRILLRKPSHSCIPLLIGMMMIRRVKRKVMNRLVPFRNLNKGVDRKPRTSVSAEAFGTWNKKSDFKATVVAKNDETKEAVRARLMKSFLFNSLDPKDLEIVIDAMT